MKVDPESNDPASASASLDVWELIDRDTTLRRLGGDEALFSQLVDFFLEDHPPVLANLEAAIEQQDADSVGRAAHSMKGLTANLGAVTATRWAADLETCGRNQDLAPAKAHAQGLRDALDRLVPALQRYRLAGT